MSKSSDHNDKTQALSESQVVETRPSRPKTARPTHAKQTPTSKHDRSVWKGVVVGADEFAPPPPPRSRAKWVVVGALGVGALGVGGYAFVRKHGGTSVRDAPTPDARPVDAARPDAPPSDAAPVDAAPIDAPADAAVVDAGVDAGVKPPVKKKPPPPVKKKPPPVKKKPPPTPVKKKPH